MIISDKKETSNEKIKKLKSIESAFSPYLKNDCWLTTGPKKIPFNIITKNSYWGDSSPLATFYTVKDFLSENADYLPCLVPKRTDLVVIDIDNVKFPSSKFPQWLLDLATKMNTYTETSMSKTGLHIALRGTLPGSKIIGYLNGCKFEILRDHCVTLTGDVFENFDTVHERQNELDELYTLVFPKEREKKAQSPKSPPISNQEILRLLQQAKNREKFLKLYVSKDISDYHNDESEADFALIALIAFYTQNPDQIFEIFQGSALYKLPDRAKKWARESYRNPTILKAIEGCNEFYQSQRESAHVQEGSWEHPARIDFEEGIEHPFPIESLPECLKIAASEVGRDSQSDPALAIIPGLGMAALQTGKKLLIEEKPGLLHHPSLTLLGESKRLINPSF